MNRRRRYKAKRTRRMRRLLAMVSAVWPDPSATDYYIKALVLARTMRVPPPGPRY
jgi:hypothetical protein